MARFFSNIPVQDVQCTVDRLKADYLFEELKTIVANFSIWKEGYWSPSSEKMSVQLDFW